MSYTLTTGKTKGRVPFVGVPHVCCVLGCKKAAVMTRLLVQIRAWASLCKDHYGEDNQKLDMNKMVGQHRTRRWSARVR